MTEDAFLKNHSLPLMLPGLVEIAILIVSDWTPDRRIEYARSRAQTIAERSDVLMFGSKKNGEAGQLIAELAKVVACLSFQPGGVTLFGHHWQAEPDQADPVSASPSLADLFTFTDNPPPTTLPQDPPMSVHKPTQTPPPVEELVAQLELVSRYAGEMNQVERFTLDRETGGLPETVALHTLRLALSTLVLLATSGASWGTIGRGVTYALVHDIPEIKTGDVVTLGGLTPEQRADKARREAAAVAEIRAEMLAAAPTSGHVITDLIREYERRDHMAAQLVHFLDKAVPSVEHNKDQGVKLHMKGWTAFKFGSVRADQLSDLRGALGINSVGTSARILDPEHEALILACDGIFRLADAKVKDHLRQHDAAAYERYKAELHTTRPFPPEQDDDRTSQTPGDDQP